MDSANSVDLYIRNPTSQQLRHCEQPEPELPSGHLFFPNQDNHLAINKTTVLLFNVSAAQLLVFAEFPSAPALELSSLQRQEVLLSGSPRSLSQTHQLHPRLPAASQIGRPQ